MAHYSGKNSEKKVTEDNLLTISFSKTWVQGNKLRLIKLGWIQNKAKKKKKILWTMCFIQGKFERTGF